MPTGYTARIKDGISFQEFALNCARAFGALIELRDEPIGTKIPDEILPDAYYFDNLQDAIKKLAEVKLLTLEKAELICRENFANEISYVIKSNKEKTDLKEKYSVMLEKAMQYEPPSKEHERFKRFMIEQLQDSIKYDCTPPRTIESIEMAKPEDYIKEVIQSAERDVERYAKSYEEECKRCSERTLWIQQLKQSIIVSE